MYAETLNKVTNNYSENKGNTNLRSCHCKLCNRKIATGYGIAYVGGYNGGGYICDTCKRTIGYHGGNDTKVGTTKKHGWIISPELECNKCTDNVAMYLQSLGFNKEADCTVLYEFTGRMFEGSKGLSTILKRLDLEYTQGHFDTTRDNVGTHLNISKKNENGVNLISMYSDILANYSNSLRVGLSDYLSQNPSVCAYTFGRSIGGWAGTISASTDTYEHGVYLNFQHINEGSASRLEWRICKYNSGTENGGKDAYFRAIEACKKLTEIILKACSDIQKIEALEGRNANNRNKRMAVCEKATDRMIKYLQKEYDKRDVVNIA